MRRKASLHVMLTGLLLSCAAPSFALYKCEADGRTIYSDRECAEGKALNVNTALLSSASDANRQAYKEKQMLARIERERHQQEAREDRERRRFAKTAAAQQKRCAKLARRQKWADEDAALATAKSAETARRKARRMSEDYLAECGQADASGMASYNRQLTLQR